MNKSKLRIEMKQKLSEMSEADYRSFSTNIKEQLIHSEEWARASTVGITISTGREVDTRGIIEAGWKSNKRIVVPKCYPKTKQLKFYQINSFKEVEDSFFSLKEPIISLTPFVPKSEIDLLIVPGIIFDRCGFRIGFGGGYYDRFLKDFQTKTISLAFQFQIVDKVPTEVHDIPVEKLISNT